MLTLTKILERVREGQHHVLGSDSCVFHIRCQEQGESGANTGLLRDIESALVEIVAVLVKFRVRIVMLHTIFC